MWQSLRKEGDGPCANMHLAALLRSDSGLCHCQCQTHPQRPAASDQRHGLETARLGNIFI
eukprot:scaffold11878_cov89-Isochrysis_galbana.AAC.1